MSDKKAAAADGAFKSPTQLAMERFGSRSPTRSPTKSNGPSEQPVEKSSGSGKDALMAQMAVATGVVIKKSVSSGGSETSDNQVTTALDKANAALATASGVAQLTADTGAESLRSGSAKPAAANTPRSNLDMKNNDNAFHVIANLVTDRFLSRLSASGSTTLEITEGDIDYLHRTLQPSVRKNFVDALRYRLEHNCPEDSEANIHVLTRQCRELGLDREGDNNPLLISSSVNGGITITNVSALMTSRSLLSTGSSNPPGRPPQHPGVGSKGGDDENQLGAKLEEQRKQLRKQHEDMKNRLMSGMSARGDDNSLGDSTSGGTNDAQTCTSESLERQQLMAELREASNFMAESVTQEAASFWRQHVLELQARLRALHGEGSSPPTHMQKDETSVGRRELTQDNLKANSGASSGYDNSAVENIYDKSPETPQSDHPLDSAGGSFPMVDVIAPADLPGGYHFEAEIDGQRFLAIVPEGGVKKGEMFSCIMRDLENVGADPPVGRWKDRLCDFSAHGIVHPLIVNSLFCPLLALGQIMTRIDIDWLAHPIEGKKNPLTFSTMRTIVVFWVVMNLLIFLAFNYKWSQGLELSGPDKAAIAFLNCSMLTFSIYTTALTRASLREKYVIPEQRCYDLEDCCCATFCMPCTVCQMGRHTADYEHYDANCCSETGIIDSNATKDKGSYSGYMA